MDFPEDVDCIIYGTGLPESILSASLSILGKHVLHIDQNNYYGGSSASIRFEDLARLLLSPDGTQESKDESNSLGGGVLQFENSSYSVPSRCSAMWFLDGHPVSNSDSSQPAASSNSTPHVWTRASVEARMRRVDLDLLPKIIFATSPTVTALLRSDVTRYLEFRFVSRCLAYTTVPNSPEKQAQQSDGSTSITAAPTIVQVPVGRSELFKTKLLTLRQKRLLGAFFEWCFNLTVDDNQTPIAGAPQNGSYDAYAIRPFREFLREQHNLDDFLQEVITTNLALAGENIMTDEAIRRIRRLLISTNRFGQHPILWPLYGCGDLPQSYCRMSAVFGAVFCLDCQLVSLRPIETQLGDTGNRPAVDNIGSGPTRSARQFVARLSNGHEVRTTCCVIGADCAPQQWIQTQIHRWCARAILITDRSLYPVGRKPTDVSILAIPLSGRGEAELDPVLLLEIPVETARRNDVELFVVHVSAQIRSASLDPAQLFQPMLNRLFELRAPESCDEMQSDTSSPLPRVLWAGYFCIPDLSSVETITSARTNDPRFSSSTGFFLSPGADSSFDMDSTAIAAESVFRDVAARLDLHPASNISASTLLTAAGGSDGPRLSTLTSSNGTLPTQSTINPYVSLDARWDGLFPPRPPRPEDIISGEDDQGTLQTSASPDTA
ncbi:DNA helicase II / ATP-dependent DNA helicase PcrA [Clonorchis sinensis]|uniref:DNA helicase II / ATP-dependent DNA helicase PcrA n=1 Tax=Clonorchis sinensis TaxID=79923 RepID=A0A8T1M014_CLOSI|nr:DNA helicase II / ATP-dependent DNA helicase PcrA [Clonorchis sinensis]